MAMSKTHVAISQDEQASITSCATSETFAKGCPRRFSGSSSLSEALGKNGAVVEVRMELCKFYERGWAVLVEAFAAKTATKNHASAEFNAN